MSFLIELTRNGKPNIVYKNYKYRESYTVQSGETVWRCLGRDCGASIKTDAARTCVKVTKAKHSGPHPVTMRSLSSSTPRQRRGPPVTSPASVTSSPAPDVSPAPAAALPAPVPPTAEPVNELETSSASPEDVTDLAAENIELKETIRHLKEELWTILDHSIESDTRLMQYTSEVFAPASSSRVDPSDRASVADCAVQCDSLSRAPAADCAVQCDMPTICKDESCEETRALVGRLKTTIEVLEAELQCFRTEKKNCSCGDLVQGEVGWTVHHHKRKHLPVTENRFKVLDIPSDETPQQLNQPHKEEAPSRSKRKRRRKPSRVPAAGPTVLLHPSKTKPRVEFRFTSINIEGDSHSRGVAGLVQRMVGDATTVMGDCKPGAKLLSVVSDRPPPRGSCSVIIAGTNDLASGQQRDIYTHLERRIAAKLRTAKVVVATLPYRHDLPARHPLHLETALVNAYIWELCARHRGVEVLDFNRIGRSAFSSHGMHLKSGCKRQLAELLVESVQRLDTGDVAAPPSPPTIVIQPPTPQPARTQPAPTACETPGTPDPRVLPFDTFAEALKSAKKTDSKTIVGNSDVRGKKNGVMTELVTTG